MGIQPQALDRIFSCIRSARAFVGSASRPDDPQAAIEAIAHEISEAVADLIYAATALALSGLPGIESGPWGTAGPPLPEDRQEAPALWELLKPLSVSERRVLVEDAREFRSWALCELLCAESLKAADDDPDRAYELVDLACRIAELVPGEESWRWRLQGYAWAHIGNARRLQGDQRSAEQAFARAGKLWQAGAAGDPGLLDDAQGLGLVFLASKHSLK